MTEKVALMLVIDTGDARLQQFNSECAYPELFLKSILP